MADTNRFSAIPDWYEFEPADSAEPKAVPSTTKFANFPQHLGGGQYAINPGSGDVIESERSVPQSMKEQIRQGIPSWRVQVDHTFPLKHGSGTNMPQNLSGMKVEDHDKKTKVGAVAGWLYKKNKISYPEFQNLSINWQGKDVSDVKVYKGGLANDDKDNFADAKLTEWSKPTKIGVGEMYEGLLSLFGRKPKTEGGKLYTEALSEGPRGFVGQTAQGIASGATLGWFPHSKVENPTLSENIGNIAGSVTGTLLSFGWLGKIVKGAATGFIPKATKLSKTGETPGWLKILDEAKLGVKGTNAFNTAARKQRVLKNVGLFGLHGQLSRQEENTLNGRVKRLMSDAAFGGMLGAAPSNLKGAAGAMMGTYVLSALEGASTDAPMEDILVDSLVNSLVVGGLHGMGMIGYKGKLESSVNKASATYRAKLGAEPKMVDGKYSVDALINDNQILIENLKTRTNRGEIRSMEEYQAELTKIIVSGRQLYKGGLAKEQKLLEDIKDVRSIFKRTNNMSKSEFNGIPENTGTAFDGLNNLKQPLKTNKQPWVETPGVREDLLVTTGVAGKVDRATKNDMLALHQKIKDGDGVEVIGVRVKDGPLVDFLRLVGLYKNPTKNVQFFAREGGKIYKLGWAPSTKRIIDPEVGINTIRKKYNLPEMNAERYNKNNISDMMDSLGVGTVVGEIRKLGISKKGEPYVNIEVGRDNWLKTTDLNKDVLGDGYANARAKVNKTYEKRAEEIIYEPTEASVKTSKIKSDTTKKVEEVKEDIDIEGTRASSEIRRILNFEGSDNGMSVAMLSVENAYAKGIEALANLKSQLIVGGAEMEKSILKSLKPKENHYTAGDFFQFLQTARQNKRLSPSGKTFYNLLLGEDSFYRSLSKQDRLEFNRLKVFDKTGQIEQKTPLKGTPEQVQAKKVKEAIVKKTVSDKKSNKITEQKVITRQNVKENSNKIYLFGDNLEKKGMGGQAKAMRGESNAIGIPTKKKPTMSKDAFFTDKEYSSNVKAIDKAFSSIPAGKEVVIPKDGLGTGRAKLKEKAPKTFKYLEKKINERKAEKPVKTLFAKDDTGKSSGEKQRDEITTYKGKKPEEIEKMNYFESMRKAVREDMVNILEEAQTRSQGSGNLSRKQYLGDLTETLNGYTVDKRLRNFNLEKRQKIVNEEIDQIVTGLKEEMVPKISEYTNTKFETSNELSFSGKKPTAENVKDAEAKTMEDIKQALNLSADMSKRKGVLNPDTSKALKEAAVEEYKLKDSKYAKEKLENKQEILRLEKQAKAEGADGNYIATVMDNAVAEHAGGAQYEVPSSGKQWYALLQKNKKAGMTDAKAKTEANKEMSKSSGDKVLSTFTSTFSDLRKKHNLPEVKANLDKVSSVQKLKKNIDAGKKSKNKATVAFNKALEGVLTKAFPASWVRGRKLGPYYENWTLDKILRFDNKEGQLFLNSLSQDWRGTTGKSEVQTKKIIESLYKRKVQEGKIGKLDDKAYKAIYGERKVESRAEQKDAAGRKAKGEELPPEAIGADTTKYASVEAARSDVTPLDMAMIGLLNKSIGGKYSPKEAAHDGVALGNLIIQRYNTLATKSKRGTFVAPKVQQQIIKNSFKSATGKDIKMPKIETEKKVSKKNFEEEYTKLALRIGKAEKTPDRKMSKEETALMEKDWKAYSKSRGYSEREIADFEKLQKLFKRGKELGYTNSDMHSFHIKTPAKKGKPAGKGTIAGALAGGPIAAGILGLAAMAKPDEAQAPSRDRHKTTGGLPDTTGVVEYQPLLKTIISKKPYNDERTSNIVEEYVKKIKVSIAKGAAVKNNNPMNLKYANQTNSVKNGIWAKFPTPELGFRAGMKQLQADMRRDDTVATFVKDFAPKSENDVEEYIAFLVKNLNVTRDTKINTIDIKELAKVVAQKESNTIVTE